jgi:hypothetical protein
LFILSCLPSALLDFAIPKWKADPNVRIEDAYKWLYQATRGGEHAAPDRQMAKQWLDDEWRSLGTPIKNESLWNPLCGDASIGRVNLRVFKVEGGKEDDILNAFLASSREFKQIGTSFTDAWIQLGKRLKKRAAGKLSYAEWKRLDAEMAPRNYQAIHHSKEYDAAERPAYRVITKAEMKSLRGLLRPAT